MKMGGWFKTICELRLLPILLFLALPAAMSGQLIFTTNDGTIQITGYNGSPGDLIIPASTNGYPVTSIEYGAFHNNSNLTSITIPGSVTNIGVFFGCYNLRYFFFEGNAIPDPGSFFDEFLSVQNVPRVYYLPGTTGWGPSWGGLPTAQWVLGGLAVAISPSTAANQGARWQVDGGSWQTNLAAVPLLPGYHSVHFNQIIGWQSPPDQATSVGTNFNSFSQATGTYLVIPQPPTFKVLHNFTGLDGVSPRANLIVSGNVLYGTTCGGGISNSGTVFSIHTDGSGFTNIYSFTGGSDGGGPQTALVLSGNTLYGNTPSTVFKVNIDGSGYQTLHTFTGNWGVDLFSGLTLSSNMLYGTTEIDFGTIFRIKTDGTCFTNLHTFTTDNDEIWWPYGDLVVSGSTIYGNTFEGMSGGSVFCIQTDGTGFTKSGVVLPDNFWDARHYNNGFDTILSGKTAFGNDIQDGIQGPPVSYGALYAENADGSDYTTLHIFYNGPDAADPSGSMTPWGGLAISGNILYGMAEAGGTNNDGTIYAISFPPQQLSIILLGTNVVLTWPSGVFGAEYDGYSLQFTTNLVPPVIWADNATTPAAINSQNVVTNCMTGTQQYFRLIK